MNWRYLGIEALLPLAMALSLSMAVGIFEAVRLTYLDRASRPAALRMLKAMAIMFPLAFLVSALWEGRGTWNGILGATLGNPGDQKAMGLLRLNGEGILVNNPYKAAYWFSKAAEQGDAEAELFMAHAYMLGNGLPHDPAMALHWAKLSGEKGLPDGMILAGDLLPMNESVRWYQRALPVLRRQIELGDASACFSYGLMFLNGKGVSKDPIECLSWMYVARSMGLGSGKAIMVQLLESSCTASQKNEASRRSNIHIASLPHSP